MSSNLVNNFSTIHSDNEIPTFSSDVVARTSAQIILIILNNISHGRHPLHGLQGNVADGINTEEPAPIPRTPVDDRSPDSSKDSSSHSNDSYHLPNTNYPEDAPNRAESTLRRLPIHFHDFLTSPDPVHIQHVDSAIERIPNSILRYHAHRYITFQRDIDHEHAANDRRREEIHDSHQRLGNYYWNRNASATILMDLDAEREIAERLVGDAPDFPDLSNLWVAIRQLNNTPAPSAPTSSAHISPTNSSSSPSSSSSDADETNPLLPREPSDTSSDSNPLPILPNGRPYSDNDSTNSTPSEPDENPTPDTTGYNADDDNFRNFNWNADVDYSRPWDEDMDDQHRLRGCGWCNHYHAPASNCIVHPDERVERTAKKPKPSDFDINSTTQTSKRTARKVKINKFFSNGKIHKRCWNCHVKGHLYRDCPKSHSKYHLDWLAKRIVENDGWADDVSIGFW